MQSQLKTKVGKVQVSKLTHEKQITVKYIQTDILEFVEHVAK